MKKLAILFYMLILACGNAHVADCQSGQRVSKMKIPVDLEKEKQLQVEVGKGHQPWRLERNIWGQIFNVDNHVDGKDLTPIVPVLYFEPIIFC